MPDAPSFSTATFVTDPDSGQLLVVESGREYAEFIANFHKNYCRHSLRRVFRIKLSNGAIQVRECCETCGQAFGTARSQSDKDWVQTLPWLPEGLTVKYKDDFENRKRQVLVELAKKQHRERGAFTKSYNSYMSSQEGELKRKLIFRRSNGVCEGCGTRKATEVHHHTYTHLFDEFLFELVALCSVCHDRITQERKTLRQSEAAERFSRLNNFAGNSGACETSGPDVSQFDR